MIEWSLVHIPKTGGASIAGSIGYYPDDHRRASQCSGFLVTFVRNPLSRLVSAFEFLRDPKYRQCVIPESLAFREFVTRQMFAEFDTDFFRPMAWWLDAPVGFVGRFETLADDYDRLCGLVGIKQPVPLSRMHIREGARPWREHYDPETLRIARHYYADDMERFGYGAETD